MSTVPPPPPDASGTPPKPKDRVGEELLSDLRAAVEAERQKSGGQLDLRTLEGLAAKYRRAIDETRADIAGAEQTDALHSAVYARLAGVIPAGRVGSLLRVQDAMREGLDGLQIEIRDLRDAAAKAREDKILRVTAWSTAVQAFATVFLVAVTLWYVKLTDKMVRVQVDPSVELVIPKNTNSVIVANNGGYPIVDVRLNLQPDLETPKGLVSSGDVDPGIPAVPRNGSWHAERLQPGQKEIRFVREEAEQALREMQTWNELQAQGKVAPVGYLVPLLHITLTYRREVDGKPYLVTKRMKVVRAVNTGDPVLRSED